MRVLCEMNAAKMWKHISGVPKAVKEKNTKAKALRDTRKYEKTRTRNFSAKWQVGRPGRKHDEKGIICNCEWCIEKKPTLVA